MSSAALSLPVDSSGPYGEDAAGGRSKQRPLLLGTVAVGVLLAGGFVAWLATRAEPPSNAIAVSVGTPGVTLTVPPPPPPPSASATPVPSAKPPAAAPPVVQAPRPVVVPKPNAAPVPRRQRPAPAAPAAPVQPSRPTAPDDIPNNPYR
jgi:outer membrane biosynthesis protein TonB